MPVRIRLARHGRKARPIYHIVVADSRAPRDGKYIENLGSFNPNTNPATIDLDFEKALDWLQKGAQPSDTCKSILSRNGVLMKKHLLEGVRKGAFSEEEAEKRFSAWMKEKETKLLKEVEKVEKAVASKQKESLDREAKVNEERAADIAKKKVQASAKTSAQEAETSEGEENVEAVTEEHANAENLQEEIVEEVSSEDETSTEETETEVTSEEESAEEEAQEESTEDKTEE